MKNVLNSARAEHVQAVKDRIDNVERMKDVVDLTGGLFALSKVWRYLHSCIIVYHCSGNCPSRGRHIRAQAEGRALSRRKGCPRQLGQIRAAAEGERAG